MLNTRRCSCEAFNVATNRRDLFREVPPTRSRTMRAIRSTANRSTEWRFRAAMIRASISGWRLRDHSVEGVPDFFFRIQRLAVFVDGCFWHGCSCRRFTRRTRRAYWKAKISQNQRRDLRVTRILRSQGIAVIRFRECELRDELHVCIHRLRLKLKGRAPRTRSRDHLRRVQPAG